MDSGNSKPLGYKSYGSIPHLPGSRLGPGDHHIELGQAKIATEKVRDKHDIIIVQEKLDGGNVGVVKLNGQILALTRAGYLASSSKYITHHVFVEYVRRNESRFKALLNDGERVCGEWLFTAVGTRYNLPHEPFVPFDLITGSKRVKYLDFAIRVLDCGFVVPQMLSYGPPMSIDVAQSWIRLSTHGAIEQVEGVIWRVERKGEVDFICKYVRPDKIDGKYLSENGVDIVNGMIGECDYLIDYYISICTAATTPL